jgi:hypothetical protein
MYPREKQNVNLTIRCGPDERERIHKNCDDWSLLLEKSLGRETSISEIVRLVFRDIDQKLTRGEQIEWPPRVVSKPKKRKRPKRPKR